MNTPLSNDLRNMPEAVADIASELREHPERWMQDDAVRFADGSTTDYLAKAKHESAVCWCFIGHVCRRAPDLNVAMDWRTKIGNYIGGDDGHRDIGGWNDIKGRTVEDVIAVCDGLSGVGFAMFRAATLSALRVTEDSK